MGRESNKVFRDIARIRTLNPEGIRIPALVLAAENDGVPPRINQRLAQAFAGEFQTLPVAHDMMLGPQWRLAADRIIEWLKGLDTHRHVSRRCS
jgi:hypothetical protein